VEGWSHARFEVLSGRFREVKKVLSVHQVLSFAGGWWPGGLVVLAAFGKEGRGWAWSAVSGPVACPGDKRGKNFRPKPNLARGLSLQ
jgi:hypothetical protein